MAHATTQVRTCYLVRHAIAEPRGPDWPDDARRPLSPRGLQRMRQIVGGLDALGVRIDQVISSPLVRARQTAELLAAGLGPTDDAARGDVVLLPELAPDVDPVVTMRAVAGVATASTVALVGHEPDLGQLAAWWLGTDRSVPFKKGAVCCLAVRRWPARRGDATLIWLAPPTLLRLAGRSV